MAFHTLCSRVYLGYPTVAQVIASSTLRMVLGDGWFWIVNTILVYYFPAIEESGILLCDSCKEEIGQKFCY
ncbi:hypothetical protein ZIOFF_012591 [Zingiber officinale]|uniref:Uncharacterized protein n=1 Tax=Zingiber officinale TaxID=94328 RepID=A0A8J5HSK9_ZINOF|nr:hypothetical protein ZIOFF_012591 [Zingiber officinale]